MKSGVVFRTRRIFAAALIAVASAVASLAPHAMAQDSATATADKVSFNIPAQPLNAALRTFAEATHLQLVYSSDLATGLNSGSVSGSFTPAEALQQLLAGSGLSSRFVSAGVVTIEKAPAANGARLLGPVQVEGLQSVMPGANGSSDPTATEGTRSYTTNALTVGSKAPLSIKETPQSVSVITQQRIQEQNLTTLTDALNQATGVTLQQIGSLQTNFYSRGFNINTFQIDGGAPLGLGNNNFYFTTPDLAEYDHVEILRGSDALFGGAGQPGGIVSLERKRPLDHDQFTAEGDAGSWGNYRAETDATGPIGLDGALRGRVVTVLQDSDYFYQVASLRKELLYGVVEADLPWDTLLRVGGSYEQQDDVPNVIGLPRYSSGADLHLPVSTCLCANWQRWNFQTPEVFVELEHKFDDDWNAKLSATRLAQTSNEKVDEVSGAVNPVSLMSTLLGPVNDNFKAVQLGLDANLNGSFQLFGRKHDLTLGADYSDANSSLVQGVVLTTSRPINVLAFTPGQLDPEPASPPTTLNEQPNNATQDGLYGNLRFRVLDPLSLIGGFRLSDFHLDRVTKNFSATTGQLTSTSPLRYNDDDVLTPYGGIVYDLTNTYSLYGSYATIYQSQANDTDTSGAPLPPMTGDTYEVGTKAAWDDGALNASVAAYRADRNNGAVQAPGSLITGLNGSSCCFLASGEVISEGIDMEISGRLAPGWQLFAGYTYNYNYNEAGLASTTGTQFQTNTPKHLFKLWTSYQLPGRFDQWTIGGGGTAQSSNFASGTVCPTFNANGTCATTTLVPFHFTVGDYFIANARIGYQLNEHWSAALNLNNIFDRTYYQTVGSSASNNFYGQPRNFMLTIRAQY
jgi:outer membrane receptor for ferric coprogen and ferric-rhodotorulic acid